jgi:hypothetical protein
MTNFCSTFMINMHVELNRFAMAFVITLWNVSMGSNSDSVQVYIMYRFFECPYYIIDDFRTKASAKRLCGAQSRAWPSVDQHRFVAPPGHKGRLRPFGQMTAYIMDLIFLCGHIYKPKRCFNYPPHPWPFALPEKRFLLNYKKI